MKRDAYPAWVIGPHTQWMFDNNWPPAFEPAERGRNIGELKRQEAAARGRRTQKVNHAKKQEASACG